MMLVSVTSRDRDRYLLWQERAWLVVVLGIIVAAVGWLWWALVQSMGWEFVWRAILGQI